MLFKSQRLIKAIPHFKGVKFMLIKEKYSSENISDNTLIFDIDDGLRMWRVYF
jgi:hypothetical protein